MRVKIADLRPSRLDINALLLGTSSTAATRQTAVDALKRRWLLFGSEVRSPTVQEVDQALARVRRM
jgi:hypothetical protein